MTTMVAVTNLKPSTSVGITYLVTHMYKNYKVMTYEYALTLIVEFLFLGMLRNRSSHVAHVYVNPQVPKTQSLTDM